MNCAPSAAPIDIDFVFGSNDINFAAPYEISRNFLLTLLKLNLTEKNMNEILRSTETMLEQTRNLCQQTMKSDETKPSTANHSHFKSFAFDYIQ